MASVVAKVVAIVEEDEISVDVVLAMIPLLPLPAF